MAEPEGLEGFDQLIGFGRDLRRRGLPVGTGRIVTFCRAAAALLPLRREDLYWAARASLVSRPEDLDAFHLAFDEYFGVGDGFPAVARLEAPRTPAISREAESVGEPMAVTGLVGGRWRAASDAEEPEGEAALGIVASAAEVLREKSFANLSEEERRRVTHLIRRLAMSAPVRRIRRLRPSPSGDRFDMRRTLRRSLRTEGEPFHRAWRGRGSRSRPLVLILDVSGSMGPYSRALMQFAFAATAAGRKVEVFCFGTRLTRITRSLRTKDPDRALRDLGRLVADWEGGTRIGPSIKQLLDRWSQRTALRGSIAVICSDGLERGDPELLSHQMARLRRLVHRIVWVNPLKGSPRYEPLARGMAAALPSIDVFLPGHNLDSLEELSRVLAG
jgi:uncharacterized protein with von Willebrand factor type A (vWA) domain